METTAHTIVCSHCQQLFKTIRGLKVHETKKHKPKSPPLVATEVHATAPSLSIGSGIPASLETVLSLLLVKNVENLEGQKQERLQREKEREEERLRREQECLQREKEREEERLRREQECLQREKEREEERLRREEERLQREKEREEERLRREQERLQREKEREEERLRREEEKRERDLDFERKRQMLFEVEDRKDQRWNEYKVMQNRAIDEWAENRKQEREDRHRFLEQQQQFMREANTKNRRLSMGEECHHQQDEMVVYGTSSRPFVQGSDLKRFIQNVVFDSPPPGMGEMAMEMCGLVDSMSSVEMFDFLGSKFDEHSPKTVSHPVVEVLAWEDVVEEVERVIDLPRDMVSTYIGHVSKTMPYSQPEKNWWMRRSSVKSAFAPVAPAPKDGYKREFPAVEEEKENPPDIAELVETDRDKYALVPSRDVQKADVVGSGNDSVSSTLVHYQLRQKMLETLQRILQTDVRRRHWLQMRWSIMTGRMFLIMERIFQHGLYIPDSLLRYLQDVKFKTENTHVEPSSRSLFKRRFIGERNLMQCQMCFCKIQPNGFEWERAHVVPSKKSTLGSNGEHNMIVCCSSCNTKTGDMDPHLHPEYRFDKSRSLFNATKSICK